MGTTAKPRGFTLIELMIVVAVLGLLAGIAIPNYVKARTSSQATACINNLRHIEAAKQEWARENNQPPEALPQAAALMPFLGRGTNGQWPACPAGGRYTINILSVAPTCSMAGADPSHVIE